MIRRNALLIATALLAGFVPAAHAQTGTGAVLSPGEVSFSIGGNYTGFQSLYVGTGTQPLGASLGGPVTPGTFAPLDEFAQSVADFFTAVDSVPFPIADADFLAGDLSTSLSWNSRVGTGRLGIGLFRRVEIGVSGSIYRTETLPIRVGLAGGTLGLNPDPAGNTALLDLVDPTGGAVGGSEVLPIEGSVLGSQLQDQVFAVTGDSLSLPATAFTVQDFETAFGVTPFPHDISEVRLGDVEVDVRVEVLRTFAEAYYPLDGDIHARLSIGGSVRIPTGDRGLETPLPEWGPDIGHGALRGSAAFDLFAGSRFWLSSGASYTRINAATVFVPVIPGGISGLAPGVEEARIAPGNELAFGVVPRFRLTREISIGAAFELERQSGGTRETGGVLSAIESRSLQSVGIELGYTSLPAYEAGETGTPIQAAVGFRAAIDGSGGAPASHVAYAQVTILHRFWGGPELSEP